MFANTVVVRYGTGGQECLSYSYPPHSKISSLAECSKSLNVLTGSSNPWKGIAI
jgi:hypothetical protein